jgi:methylmalonyl-CoA/ethylmalonyl-CoA epimerase
MVIDHVGVAVKSIDGSIALWETVFGYRQQTEVVTNTRQQANVVFLAKPGSLAVKLVEPTDRTSPVFALAQRGGGLHHLCFKCTAVDDEVARLAALGLRILSAPQPGEAFESETIAFVYAGGGLNIELIDTDRRARLLTR